MSRRLLLAAALIAAGLVLAGCAPVSVGAHQARDVRFASYHTFTWAPADALPIGDPRLDGNPFFADYLEGAVERHFREHGITLADVPADADLLVHYHAAVTQRVDTSRWHDTGQSGYQEPQIVTYDRSTIVLDVIDMRTDQLVWRGWAQDDLQTLVNDPDALKRHIEESVMLMFERLPI